MYRVPRCITGSFGAGTSDHLERSVGVFRTQHCALSLVGSAHHSGPDLGPDCFQRCAGRDLLRNYFTIHLTASKIRFNVIVGGTYFAPKKTQKSLAVFDLGDLVPVRTWLCAILRPHVHRLQDEVLRRSNNDGRLQKRSRHARDYQAPERRSSNGESRVSMAPRNLG